MRFHKANALLSHNSLISHRLYTDFGPDLKRVRPREKLKKLARRPALYDRKQVDLDCFEAIDNILALKYIYIYI
jgi:hypothetical protein